MVDVAGGERTYAEKGSDVERGEDVVYDVQRLWWILPAGSGAVEHLLKLPAAFGEEPVARLGSGRTRLGQGDDQP